MTVNERKEFILTLRRLLAMCDFVDQYNELKEWGRFKTYSIGGKLYHSDMRGEEE